MGCESGERETKAGRTAQMGNGGSHGFPAGCSVYLRGYLSSGGGCITGGELGGVISSAFVLLR